MNRERTNEAFAFKKFIDDLELAITRLLNFQKRGYIIETFVQVLEREVVGFVISKEGTHKVYELIIIYPDKVTFNTGTGIKLVTTYIGRPTNHMFAVKPYYPGIVTGPSSFNSEHAIAELRILIVTLFGSKTDNEDPWEEIQVVRKNSYEACLP